MAVETNGSIEQLDMLKTTCDATDKCMPFVRHKPENCSFRVPAVANPDSGCQSFYVPWRTDPRPGGGLLQDVYAHLGMTEFWR